ncbi:MAG: Cas10/Cmr2 second palm domain-containing protein [Candidatus Brocadia sp.]
MAVHAVLIDMVSIQRYVFGSNKLKENIGASYLIQEVYESYLQKVINCIFPFAKINFNAWKEEPNRCLIEETDIPFEVGYIGGGNALLLFKDGDRAREFIERWTTTLLVVTPGVATAVACEAFDLNNFKLENERLFRKLQENKYRFIPQTVIPRHGITAECSHTGYSMDIWNDKEKHDEQNYVSSVAYAKICASQEATKKLEEKFEKELKSGYCFTDQLDELGQLKGEDSHIAIVHIDGNGMGERFMGTDSLSAIRNLSSSVAEATKKGFAKLLEEIISRFTLIQDALGFDTQEKKAGFYKDKEKNKTIIPLRPIIIGGDDITFVCDGRLGVYFAKLFLEAFENQEVSDGKKLSACAGVAITKTKYPFHRGYEIAEDLCKNAKKRRKDNDGSGSWLDFHIAYGGFSGKLDEIRATHYKAIQGDLIFGPYKIGKHDEYGFDTLIKNIKELKDPEKGWPRSKIEELRQVLTLGKEATETFVREIDARRLELPKIKGRCFEHSLFEDSETPYFDMVELMKFYPEFALQESS